MDDRRQAGSVETARRPASARTLMLGDDPVRPEIVRLVRDQLSSGRYQPPSEAVAEQLVAWLFPVRALDSAR